MYVYITSSKVVRTRHHIRRFLHIFLVLKIQMNPCHTPGDIVERKKRNMDKSKGGYLLTVDNLKTFYCCIESPLCRINQNHFVTKL